MIEATEGAAGTAEERFARLCDELMSRPDVSQGTGKKQGFGSTALTTNDKIFAMLTTGRLVVKLPKARVEQLVAAGEGEHLDMGGRKMREWLSLNAESDLEWLLLAEEALDYVAGRR